MVILALLVAGTVAAAGLIGFVYYKETHLPPIGDFDTIIVLGAQVKADGTPSVALERRLTAALEEYRKQPRLMIVCGAQGSDEPRAEGDVMRDWLIAHGVAAADIEAETDSFNTRQNLGYAQSIMDDRGLTAALIVTSDYHVPRALALCEQAHLWPEPLRSIGVRALDLQPACAPHQMDLFEDAERRARARRLDITLDNLRARYGKTCVLRGRACFDPALGLVQREEHAFLRK